MLDQVVGAGAARFAAGDGAARSADNLDSGWPPVLVFAVVVLAVAAVAAVVVMVRRTRATIRENGRGTRR
jgi:hypothetical protein